jgi:hypothetical protein
MEGDDHGNSRQRGPWAIECGVSWHGGPLQATTGLNIMATISFWQWGGEAGRHAAEGNLKNWGNKKAHEPKLWASC